MSLWVFYFYCHGILPVEAWHTNRIIYAFYLFHVNHEEIFQVEHFVHNHGMKHATVYWAIGRGDQICLGGQITLDRWAGSVLQKSCLLFKPTTEMGITSSGWIWNGLNDALNFNFLSCLSRKKKMPYAQWKTFGPNDGCWETTLMTALKWEITQLPP